MTGIGTQIKNALGWFLTRLKGNVVNNLTSTSTDLPLSAAKGKDLQDQITSLNTKIGNHGFTLIANAYTDTAGSTTTTGVTLDEYDAFIFEYKYGNVYTTSFLCPTIQLKSMVSTQNCINMDHRKNDDVACLIYTDGSKNIKIFHNTAYYPVTIWGIKF